MNRILFSSLFILVGLTGYGQTILTLPDAIAIGLEENFAIKIAKKDLLIANNNNSWGNAGFLPTLDLTMDKTYQIQNVDLEIQGSEGIFDVSSDGAKSDRFNVGGNVNWTVFDGLAMFVTKDKLEALVERGNLDKRVTVENTLAAIYSAYYQIALEQDKMSVLQQTLEVSNARLSLAKSRYEVGKGSKLNYLAAQVDYNTDQSNVVRQRELLSNAKVDLNILLGRDSQTDFLVGQSIDINEELDLQALLDQINGFNPEMLIAVADQNVAYLEYKELTSQRLPRVNLGLAYNNGTSNNEAGQLRSSTITGISYGVTASWNIFNGFNKSREIQNAKVNQAISELEKEALELSLQAVVNKTFINYSNNLELIGLERLNVDVALENEQIALDRYELGAGTPLELREAQRNAVDSQNRLLDAQLDAKLAEIELLRLSGKLAGID